MDFQPGGAEAEGQQEGAETEVDGQQEGVEAQQELGEAGAEAETQPGAGGLPAGMCAIRQSWKVNSQLGGAEAEGQQEEEAQQELGESGAEASGVGDGMRLQALKVGASQRPLPLPPAAEGCRVVGPAPHLWNGRFPSSAVLHEVASDEPQGGAVAEAVAEASVHAISAADPVAEAVGNQGVGAARLLRAWQPRIHLFWRG